MTERNCMDQARRLDAVRLLALLLLGLAGVLIAQAVSLPSITQLRAEVRQLGMLAPMAFIAIYLVSTLVFLPKAVLSILAGAVFGLPLGVTFVMIGALLGAILAFLASRVLARQPVERLAGKHLARLDGLVAENAFVGIIIARLIPIVPFTMLNYAAGLTTVQLRIFTGATFIGMTPGAVAYVAIGAFGFHLSSWQFQVAAAGLALLTITGVIAVRLRRV